MNIPFVALLLLFLSACSTETVSIHPKYAAITSSIYASGVIKSDDQYQAFSTINGLVEAVYVTDGQAVKKGQILLKIANPLQQLTTENASLLAHYSAVGENQSKLYDAQQAMQFAAEKKSNDSLLLVRQQNLWNQGVGSKIDLEQRSLAVKNAQSAFVTARIRYFELKRQIALNAAQTAKNLAISNQQGADAYIRSQVDGIVYRLVFSYYLICVYIFTGAVFHFNLDLSKVYDYRDLNAELTNIGIAAYLNSWVYQVFSICLMSYFLLNKNIKGFFIVFLIQIFFFGIASHKSILFSPLVGHHTLPVEGSGNVHQQLAL